MRAQRFWSPERVFERLDRSGSSWNKTKSEMSEIASHESSGGPQSSLRVMIDCTPLDVGGGIQVAIALLDGLARQSEIDWTAAVPEVLYRQLSPEALARKQAFHVIDKGTFVAKLGAARALRRLERATRPDIVFTVFGPAYFIARAPHLMGFALPHMIYKADPQIDFGSFARRALSFVFAAIFRRATHLVVETETVRRRLAIQLGVAQDRISVIGNSVNPVLDQFTPSPPQDESPFSLLIPAAYYPHKNLEIVPAVAAALARLDPSFDFAFRFTLPAQEAPWRAIAARATDLGVGARLTTLGALPLPALAAAYRSASAVYLPTIREASTAVYPESFHFRRPLVTSDLDFARELCADAALYVPPRDPEATARAILELARAPDLRRALVAAGERRLATGYPSPADKLAQQLRLMRRIAGAAR